MRPLAREFNDTAAKLQPLLELAAGVRRRRVAPAADAADGAAAAAREPRARTRRPGAGRGRPARAARRERCWRSHGRTPARWSAETRGRRRGPGRPAGSRRARRRAEARERGLSRAQLARTASARSSTTWSRTRSPSRSAVEVSAVQRRRLGRAARRRLGPRADRRGARAGVRPLLARPLAHGPGSGLGLAIVRAARRGRRRRGRAARGAGRRASTPCRPGCPACLYSGPSDAPDGLCSRGPARGLAPPARRARPERLQAPLDSLQGVGPTDRGASAEARPRRDPRPARAPAARLPARRRREPHRRPLRRAGGGDRRRGAERLAAPAAAAAARSSRRPVADDSGAIPAVWFNQDWLAEKLQPGTRVRLRGQLRRNEFNVKSYDLNGAAATSDLAPDLPGGRGDHAAADARARRPRARARPRTSPTRCRRS